jgi:hypothetical protein
MIKWDPVQVIDKCDEAEKILAEALPIIKRAAAKLSEVGQIPGMPQYITSPVSNAVNSVESCGHRTKEDIQSIRSHVPAKELKRWRFRGKAMTLGLKITPAADKPYTYVPRSYSTPDIDRTRQTSLVGR